MELPEREMCYRALQTRDSRFDGLLFVGVTSTGALFQPQRSSLKGFVHPLIREFLSASLAAYVMK